MVVTRLSWLSTSSSSSRQGRYGRLRSFSLFSTQYQVLPQLLGSCSTVTSQLKDQNREVTGGKLNQVPHGLSNQGADRASTE